MAPIYIIDQYNYTIALLITLAWQLSGFAIAWTFKFDKVTDFTGGSNFFILALITLLTQNTFYSRSVCASALMMLWAARLAGFLLFRVLKTGSDTRFDEIRSHFFKFAGFWAGQIVWVWVVAMPVYVLNSPAVSDGARGGGNPYFPRATDIVGIILFGIGFIFEALGDIQKYMYKASNPPKGKPCTKGLWYFCRHPPYFGEILLQWGIWLICIGPATANISGQHFRGALYASVVSPIFTMVLLLFASGIPTAQKPTAKKYYLQSHDPPANPTGQFTQPEPKNDTWAKYKDYLLRTSVIIPCPPGVYRHLPQAVKTWVFLDLPMYRFDEATDGRAALEEEAKKHDDRHV